VINIQKVEILPLCLPIIKKGDDIADFIISAVQSQNLEIDGGDTFVVAHTIISRAEGSEYSLPDLSSSPFAEIVARKTGKDCNFVQVVLSEALKILKVKNNIIISQHKLGWICANSAVDQSNSQPGCAVTLPRDPDLSAKKIGEKLSSYFGCDISVLISDTHGRALRRGAINVAIGSYNFSVIDDARNREDIFGYKLKSTLVALADEVCSAAELVMGQANEKNPVVLIKGLEQRSPVTSVQELQYSEERRLFR